MDYDSRWMIHSFLRPSCQSKKAIHFSEIVLSLSAHVITRLLLVAWFSFGSCTAGRARLKKTTRSTRSQPKRPRTRFRTEQKELDESLKILACVTSINIKSRTVYCGCEQKRSRWACKTSLQSLWTTSLASTSQLHPTK